MTYTLLFSINCPCLSTGWQPFICKVLFFSSFVVVTTESRSITHTWHVHPQLHHIHITKYASPFPQENDQILTQKFPQMSSQVSSWLRRLQQLCWQSINTLPKYISTNTIYHAICYLCSYINVSSAFIKFW